MMLYDWLIARFVHHSHRKIAVTVACAVGITVNKNMIPYDQRKAFVTSGIRVGTPAVTTRGMREPEMDQIGDFIARVLASPEDDRVLDSVLDEVMKLCKRFPLYPELQ